MERLEERRGGAARTISVMMALTLIGKVLGLYRDRLLAIHYDTGPAANAFFTASRIPRVFFDAVFASAIAACFIPVFSEYLEKKGKKEALRFAGSFLTVVALLTGGLALLGMAFPGPFVALFADYTDPYTRQLAVSLTRVMFPTVLFSGVAFSLVGVLQAQDHFTAPALMSAVSNLAIIAYFFFLDEDLGIYGLAGAYLVGWALQGIILLPPLRKLDSPLRPGLDIRSEGMKKVLLLMGPVMVSTWVQPISLAINSRFGSRLYDGAGVSALEYASNLYLVIAGVFVLSVTNVIFPKLSRLTAGGRETAFQDTIRQTIRFTMLFILPMSVGLLTVARPLIALVYGGGSFDAFSIQITSTALRWMSLGMAGYALQNILSRAYFARQQGGAPLIAGGASILVNLLLCVLLVDRLEVAGLALASAVSSTVYALFLLFALQRGGDRVMDRADCLDLGKMALAAGGMGLSVWALLGRISPLLPGGKLGQLLALGLCALAGVVVYFLLALLLRVEEIGLALSLIKKERRKEVRAVERAKSILEASRIWRALMVLCLWCGEQWRASRAVRWFLSPGGWSRAASESSVFHRLWSRARDVLSWLYEKLRLERLFAGSVFGKTWIWCALPAALAPLAPTMAVLGLCAVGFGTVLLALMRDRSRIAPWSPIGRYVILYALIYLFGAFCSVDRSSSLRPGLLTAAFILFSLALYSSITRRDQLDAIVALLVLAAAAVSVYGILQYIFGWGYQSKAWTDKDMFSSISFRATSTLENPNMLGQYLLLAIPLGGAKLLSAKDWKSRLFYLACCGLTCVCMLLTFARGAWLGLLFAGAVFFVMLDSRLLLLAPAALAVLWVALPATVLSRFTSIGNLGDASTSYRVYIWLGTINMLRDYWLCGVGPGVKAYGKVYPKYSFSAVVAPHSHNLYLQIMCDGGIAALAVFLIILFVFFRTMASAVSREKDWTSRLYQIAFISGPVGFLIQGMTDFSFYNYRVLFLFWACLALGIVSARRSELPEGRLTA